jgi:hypothetical protein
LCPDYCDDRIPNIGVDDTLVMPSDRDGAVRRQTATPTLRRGVLTSHADTQGENMMLGQLKAASGKDIVFAGR